MQQLCCMYCQLSLILFILSVHLWHLVDFIMNYLLLTMLTVKASIACLVCLTVCFLIFVQILKPMMLRWLKEDVEKNLARKEEIIVEVGSYVCVYTCSFCTWDYVSVQFMTYSLSNIAFMTAISKQCLSFARWPTSAAVILKQSFMSCVHFFLGLSLLHMPL